MKVEYIVVVEEKIMNVKEECESSAWGGYTVHITAFQLQPPSFQRGYTR